MVTVIDTLLADNRAHLLAEVKPVLRAFEARYEINSADLDAALADGRLRETEDICDWVVALETLRALEDDTAQLE
jgi:hypothetical protein